MRHRRLRLPASTCACPSLRLQRTAMVCSFARWSSITTRTRARRWKPYAMIKARVVGGDQQAASTARHAAAVRLSALP